MRKGIKIALFTGLGIFAAGVIISVIAFGLNGFRFSKWPAPAGTTDKVKLQKVEETLDVPFDNVQVSVVNADIKIQKSTDEKCHLVYKDREGNPLFYSTVENGTLVFTQKEEFNTFDWKRPSEVLEHLANQINHLDDVEDVDILISLPEKEYMRLDIATVSGEVEAKQELNFSDVSINCVSGDIDLQNLTGVKTVDVTTTSGEIALLDMTVTDSIQAKTVSGEVVLERLEKTGTVSASTVSGEIRVRNCEFSSGTLKTNSGDVHLEDITSDNMNIETTSGDVVGRVDSSINVQAESTSGDITAPHGYVGYWFIETVSGDIALDY